MYRGNERKEQRELPFDFEEAVLSPKERARIQRGEGAFNPFQTDSKALVVEEFRISELSARVRTINNARDSMAVLPDGTPLTEVTMYGRRGEVYLLGPFSAVKRVMAGEVPSRSHIRRQIEEARQSVARSVATLNGELRRFYDGQQGALSFEGCTGRNSLGGEKTQILAGHNLMIQFCINELMALNDECVSVDAEVQSWKWWGPWSNQAKMTSDRIATVTERRDDFIRNLLQKMAAVPRSKADDHMQAAFRLLDEIRTVVGWIAAEASKLEEFLRQLGSQDALHNVYLLGKQTQIWQRDVPSIKLSLSNYVDMTNELRQLEQSVSHWLRADGAAREETTEFSNRLSKAKLAFDSERTAFGDDILNPDRSKIRPALGVDQ